MKTPFASTNPSWTGYTVAASVWRTCGLVAADALPARAANTRTAGTYRCMQFLPLLNHFVATTSINPGRQRNTAVLCRAAGMRLRDGTATGVEDRDRKCP